MDIKPEIGFDKIKFGMSRNTILDFLGDPDRIVTDEDDESEQRLEYFDLKIRLSFLLDENDRFTYLTSKNEFTQYNGKQIIGVDINIAKKEIFSELVSEWEIENYQFFETHFNESLWITLRTEFGKVIEFEMGVPFKNENEYRWPKSKV